MDPDELLDALEDDLNAIGYSGRNYVLRLAVLRDLFTPHDALSTFLRLYVEELPPSLEQRITDVLREVGGA